MLKPGISAAPSPWSAGKPFEELSTSRLTRWLHESGTYVKFTQAGAELFA
jgi:hypothetical protein